MKVGNGFRAYPVGNGEFQRIERPPGESDIIFLGGCSFFFRFARAHTKLRIYLACGDARTFINQVLDALLGSNLQTRISELRE